VNPERLNRVYVVSSKFISTIFERPVTKISILVENPGDDRQLIVIGAPAISRKWMLFTSKWVKTARARLGFIFFENCVCNSTGRSRISSCEKQSFLHFLFCRLGGVGDCLWREVTVPRLNFEFLLVRECDLQRVKPSIDFQVSAVENPSK